MAELTQPLAYSQTTRPHRGWGDVAANVRVIGLSLGVSAAGAIVLLAALLFGNGLMILGAGVVQTVAAGVSLGEFLRRANVRQKGVMYAAAACVVLGTLLLALAALYVNDLIRCGYMFAPDSFFKAVAQVFNGRVFWMRRILLPQLVPTDFLNNFAVRAQGSPAFVWTMLVHTGLTAFFCQVGIKVASKRVWCDTCSGPVSGPRNLVVLPLDQSEKLAAAVVDDDVGLAGKLAYAGVDARLDGGCAIAYAYYCPTCERTTVEVVEKVFHGLQAVVTPRTRRVTAGPALIAALDSVPAVAAESASPTGP